MLDRLVDVDPAARRGLVIRWRGSMRYIDLRALRWIEDGSVPVLNHGRQLRPRLSSDGRTFQHEWRMADDRAPYRGVAVSSIAPQRTHIEARVPEPVRCTGMSLRDDRYWYVTATEEIAVVRTVLPAFSPAHAAAIALGPIDVAATLQVTTYDPLPRKVLQSAFFDDAREVIVSASWGEIMVHRILGEKLDPACYVKTTGDVTWVAIAGPYLAAHVKTGAHRGITVWKLDASLANATIALRVEDKVRIAALSRDGRYLCVGLVDERVAVYGLDDGSNEIYDEHTDDVSYVGFVGDDQLLVTADDDNRVILRPRTPMGYARALMETELGGD